MEYSEVALFTDLDGTLFNSARQVSQNNRAAIREFVAGGGSFGISTGRGPVNARHMLPGVELNAWSVVLNGAQAYNFREGKASGQICLDKAAAADLMRWVLRELPEVNIMLCTEDKLFFPTDPARGDPDFVAHHQPMEMASLEAAIPYDWMKILFCAPRPMLERIKAYGEASGAAAVMDSIYTSPVYIEYMPPRVNKGLGLRRLRQQPDMRDKCFIAVGDYTNDLELLEEADVAVAVSNALPEVKAAADYVICSNDEDAIAYLIRELIPRLPKSRSEMK